jgi:hypothetical protein
MKDGGSSSKGSVQWSGIDSVMSQDESDLPSSAQLGLALNQRHPGCTEIALERPVTTCSSLVLVGI